MGVKNCLLISGGPTWPNIPGYIPFSWNSDPLWSRCTMVPPKLEGCLENSYQKWRFTAGKIIEQIGNFPAKPCVIARG